MPDRASRIEEGSVLDLENHKPSSCRSRRGFLVIGLRAFESAGPLPPQMTEKWFEGEPEALLASADVVYVVSARTLLLLWFQLRFPYNLMFVAHEKPPAPSQQSGRHCAVLTLACGAM